MSMSAVSPSDDTITVAPPKTVTATQADFPTVPNLSYYLTTHDVYTTDKTGCTIKENRFKIDNYVDPDDDSIKNLYCWKGIIRQQPDCAIGSVCDPYSYTGARSRFCVTWGCQPFTFVSNEGTEDAGLPVYNERGGINVYNRREDCQGAFVNKLKCVVQGLRQSVDNAFAPENKGRFAFYLVALFGLSLFTAIMYRNLPTRTKKNIKEELGPHYTL